MVTCTLYITRDNVENDEVSQYRCMHVYGYMMCMVAVLLLPSFLQANLVLSDGGDVNAFVCICITARD